MVQVNDAVFKPSLKIGVGLRSGLNLSLNPGDTTLSLSDSLDQLMFRPFFAGQLTKNIGLFVQANGSHNSFGLIDAYFELKACDEFQALLGQHIPAINRHNFSGPFFNNSWNYAAIHNFPFDAAARDRGVTFWGTFLKGMIKYHLSMVDLQSGRKPDEARFAGRVTLNFLDPEAGYYASETYFGKQDVLAIGGVVSGQKTADRVVPASMDGMTPARAADNDFFAFAIDLLFEKNLGSAGTITLAADYLNFENVGADYQTNEGLGEAGKGFAGALNGIMPGQSYQVVVSWLSPTKLGPGQLQPNVRVQGFSEDAGDAMIYDVGLGYIVDGFNHLYRLNYQHGSFAGDDSDSLQIGAQMQL